MPIKKKLSSSKSYVSKLIFVVLLIFIMTIIGCGANTNSNKVQTNQGTLKEDGVLKTDNQTPTDAAKTNPQVNKNPIVTITMEDGNTVKIELLPTVAPNTVRNFISLVHKGFYNGLIFHRVIPGFMVQGGDPQGTGQGGAGYSIKGEFNSNGFNNSLLHDRGIISMARTSEPNSAGSQFFIMVAKAPSLDGKYAAFGKVIEGMSEVDKIVNSKNNSRDKPLEDQKMKTVTVETFGVNYPVPEVLK